MKKLLFIILLFTSCLYGQTYNDSLIIIASPGSYLTRTQIENLGRIYRRPIYLVFDRFRIDTMMPAGSLFRDTSGVYTYDTSGNAIYSGKRHNFKYRDYNRNRNYWVNYGGYSGTIDTTILTTWILNHDPDSLFSSKLAFGKFAGWLLKYKTENKRIIDTIHYDTLSVPIDTVYKDTLVYIDSLGFANIWNDTSGNLFLYKDSIKAGFIKLSSDKITFGLSDSTNVFRIDTLFRVYKTFAVGTDSSCNFKVDTAGDMLIKNLPYKFPLNRTDSTDINSILGLFVLKDSAGNVAFDTTVLSKIRSDSIDSIRFVKSEDMTFLYLYEHNKTEKFHFFKRDSIDSIKFVRELNNVVRLDIYEHGKEVKSTSFTDSVLNNSGTGMIVHSISGDWHDGFPLTAIKGGTGLQLSDLIDGSLIYWNSSANDTAFTVIPPGDSNTSLMLNGNYIPYWGTPYFDTAAIRNDINNLFLWKLNISDTANMLSNYLDGKDTTIIRMDINNLFLWKQDAIPNLSDTSLYLKKIDSLLGTDYARNWQIPLKLNLADTTAMLENYLDGKDTIMLRHDIDLKKDKSDTTESTGWTPLWRLGQYLPLTGGTLSGDLSFIPSSGVLGLSIKLYKLGISDFVNRYWALYPIQEENQEKYQLIFDFNGTPLQTFDELGRIKNITAGISDLDAVNLKQLNDSLGNFLMYSDSTKFVKRTGDTMSGNLDVPSVYSTNNYSNTYYWTFGATNYWSQYFDQMSGDMTLANISTNNMINFNANGHINIPTDATYDINGSPHLHSLYLDSIYYHNLRIRNLELNDLSPYSFYAGNTGTSVIMNSGDSLLFDYGLTSGIPQPGWEWNKSGKTNVLTFWMMDTTNYLATKNDLLNISGVTGNGIATYLPLWSGSNSLINSQITQTGSSAPYEFRANGNFTLFSASDPSPYLNFDYTSNKYSLQASSDGFKLYYDAGVTNTFLLGTLSGKTYYNSVYYGGKFVTDSLFMTHRDSIANHNTRIRNLETSEIGLDSAVQYTGSRTAGYIPKWYDNIRITNSILIDYGDHLYSGASYSTGYVFTAGNNSATSGAGGLSGYTSGDGYGILGTSSGGSGVCGDGLTGVSGFGSLIGCQGSGGSLYGVYGSASGSGISIYASNDVSATSYTTRSDIRLKKNIRNIDKRNISDLNAVKFDWKSNNKSDVGLIADSVEKFIPEAVSTHDITELDKVGRPTVTTKNVKSINYNVLVVYLIEEVKNLNKRIEILEEKLKGK